MSKLRIHELAKELNIDHKQIIDQLQKMSIPVKSHMSTLSDEVSIEIRKMFGKSKEGQDGKKEQKSVSSNHELKDTEKNKQHFGQNRGNVNQKGSDRSMNNENNHSKDKTVKNNQDVKSNQAKSGQSKPEQKTNIVKNNQAKTNQNEKSIGQGTNKTSNQRPASNNNTKNSQNRSNTNQKPAAGQNQVQSAITAKANTTERDFDTEFEYKDKAKVKPEPVSKPKRSENHSYGNKNSNYKNNKNYKGKGKYNKQRNVEPPREFAEIKYHVVIDETIGVQDLAHQIGKKATDVIMKLMSLGVMATINQELDVETATIIAEEFGATVEVKVTKEEELFTEIEDNPEDLITRPAVVTIMGHVDHGKTSLLDKIRSANVTSTEAGGITQHIGAYQVEAHGQKITFLDTPGHEAFTAMRARGAQVTDIAILVVAADDGVMPQTIEAIDHAKAAEVPIIIAINKIDKPGADIDRIKQELTNYGLVSEEWGGDTIMVPVSAKSGQGIPDLLDMILLVAEVAELKANPERNARGKVVESKLDKGRGSVATLLVQTGTLNIGDFLIVGTTQGRIRAMFDHHGRTIKSAGPSVPVEILGLNEVPEAGDDFIAVENEKLAKQVADKRQKDKHHQAITRNMKVSLEDIFAQIQEGEVRQLNIVLKADVQGSIEAIKQSLEKIGNNEVRVNILRTAVGGIREADVMLAAASNAIIIGFNVRPDVGAKRLAEKESVEIKTYRVIYEAIEDVKAALSGLLAPEIKEVELGQAEVRNTFKVPKVGVVAGCYVLEGKITRNAKIRVLRDSIVIHDGQLASLKRFKDDVKEVATGYECGLGIERFNDLREGDILEAYTFEEIKRAL